ncbi:unnamed protein product [Clonostachys rhizophaga]|uniref:Ankyrin n=1 Tax=Clonostachys rhizophaga TaxID=160324 RepID=A0A9N9YXA5_9HYPO|nr:unnamed protein product [Clonostachys rhizophaga]
MQRTYDREYLGAFNILLQAGANVDSPCPLIDVTSWFAKDRRYSKLLEEMKIPKEWYPTCLDWGYQRDTELFDLMLLRSMSPDGTMTRHGILRAAMHGTSALSAYLRSRESIVGGQASNFLELVMREQVSKIEGWEFFNISAFKSLIDVGVQIHKSDRSECCSRLLQDARRGINNETYERLDRFLQDRSCVTPETISQAVSEKGTTFLERLSKFSVEVGDIGLHALLTAARNGNFDAVNWLLGAGVNIKAGICDDFGLGDDFTVVTLLIQEIDSHRNIKAKMSMLQHLIDCGAELKERATDEYAGGLFKHYFLGQSEEIATICRARTTTDLLAPWLLDRLGVGSRKIAGAELQALFVAASVETTDSLLIFNKLYTSYGLPPDPQAILASLIKRQAGDQLIQEVIQESASIDVYVKTGFNDCWSTPLQAAASIGNYPLVLQLLDRGADVNAPARGFHGFTALQAICRWGPVSGEERHRQQNIINLLIKSGANINVEPEAGGLTAIMASAWRGDVELTAMLLAHGADPNLHMRTRKTGYLESTLDLAIGRCDVAKLLLDAGALSARRGLTGYEGAILKAEKCGMYVVAKVLRDHIERQEKQFRIYPELWACHNAVMKKMDKQDAERCKKSLHSGHPAGGSIIFVNPSWPAPVLAETVRSWPAPVLAKTMR